MHLIALSYRRTIWGKESVRRSTENFLVSTRFSSVARSVRTVVIKAYSLIQSELWGTDKHILFRVQNAADCMNQVLYLVCRDSIHDRTVTFITIVVVRATRCLTRCDRIILSRPGKVDRSLKLFIGLIMVIIITRGEIFLAHRCAAEHGLHITGLDQYGGRNGVVGARDSYLGVSCWSLWR